MSQEYFKTFNNTPKSRRTQGQQEASRRHNDSSRNNTIGLKSQIQQILRSNKASANSRNMKKSHKKYPSEISLMMSDVSFSQFANNQDIPLSLLTLQVEVTEEILALKQDKLTLLSEYNISLGNRFKVERQLVKLKKNDSEKDRESSSMGGDLWLTDFQSSPSAKNQGQIHPLILKNRNLKKQYQEINKAHKRTSSDASDNKNMNDLEQIQEQTAAIEEELKRMDEKAAKINQQRFETFFPQKTSTNNNSFNLKATLEDLKRQRDGLYKKMTGKNPHSKHSQFLISLLEENEQLQSNSDILLRKKGHTQNSGSLKSLAHKLEKTNAENQILMEQIKSLMEKAERMTKENQKLFRHRY